MRLPRASGVLLHPTSLPGRHGIGDLGSGGPRLRRFPRRHRPALVADAAPGTDRLRQLALSVALLVRRQSPVDRPGISSSGGGSRPRLAWSTRSYPIDQVDFDAVAVLKEGVLRLAYERLKKHGDDPRFQSSSRRTSVWLDDYVLYQALKDVHGGCPWYEWEPELVARDPVGVRRWRERLERRNSATTRSCSTRSRASGRRCERHAMREESC